MELMAQKDTCGAKGFPHSALRSSRGGFTLVEMLIVVAVVGMLMAAVFKLVGLAGQNAAKAKTVARMQRIQNALAAYYAEYGMYPPVKAYSNTNPFKQAQQGAGETDYDDDGGKLNSENANRAAGAYSIGFSFPLQKGYEKYIATRFEDSGSPPEDPNSAVTHKDNGPNWPQTTFFRFGMLSYLLPRLAVMGFEEDDLAGSSPKEIINSQFFNTEQWRRNNTSSKSTASLRAQFSREKEATAKWLPELAGCVDGGRVCSVVFGVDLKSGGIESYKFDRSIEVSNQEIALSEMTVKDGWENALFYYSAPPYQSYRLWSAGPDGCTFPPWVTMETVEAERKSDAKKIRGWLEDDIVRFDR